MNDSLAPFVIFLMLTFVLAALIPFIFFLLTLQKTLKVISPENRRMQPAQVWLMLVPLFNIVWMFIMVNRIADSIKNECIKLHIASEEARPTYNIGIAMCILYLCGIIPIVGGLGSIAGVVCWIIYWVKVNEYKKRIIENKNNFLFDIERETSPTSPL